MREVTSSLWGWCCWSSPRGDTPTAAALELELRGQLARLGPYSAADAVKEVETALFEGGEAMEELNLLEDEGGIVPAFPPRSQDAIRTEPHPLRSADETTTEPGPGVLRLSRH